MSVETSWIHGLEIEQSWLGRSQLAARTAILESMTPARRAKAGRFELLSAEPADEPVVRGPQD